MLRMLSDFQGFMKMAIQEAEASLREGNHGFGAVVVRAGRVLARAHDTDAADRDPTAHAELKAVSAASRRLGADLSECILVCTHEPCPMCAGAVVWSGLKSVVFGCGIQDAVAQGRRRITIPAAEVFSRAGADIQVTAGVMREECAVLYDQDVRREIRRLRGASRRRMKRDAAELAARRIEWYRTAGSGAEGDPLEAAYRLLLCKLGITEADAPVVEQSAHRIVFHSRNPCPTLQACRILGLDTRTVCRLSSEAATDALVKQVDPGLRFTRTYRKLRPYADFCEEMIVRAGAVTGT
jgi:tRNA(adenine34) deaminase